MVAVDETGNLLERQKRLKQQIIERISKDFVEGLVNVGSGEYCWKSALRETFGSKLLTTL